MSSSQAPNILVGGVSPLLFAIGGPQDKPYAWSNDIYKEGVKVERKDRDLPALERFFRATIEVETNRKSSRAAEAHFWLAVTLSEQQKGVDEVAQEFLASNMPGGRYLATKVYQNASNTAKVDECCTATMTEAMKSSTLTKIQVIELLEVAAAYPETRGQIINILAEKLTLSKFNEYSQKGFIGSLNKANEQEIFCAVCEKWIEREGEGNHRKWELTYLGGWIENAFLYQLQQLNPEIKKYLSDKGSLHKLYMQWIMKEMRGLHGSNSQKYQDLEKLIAFLDSDHPDSQYLRGLLYLSGAGTEWRDAKKGIELLQQAANQGHEGAKKTLEAYQDPKIAKTYKSETVLEERALEQSTWQGRTVCVLRDYGLPFLKGLGIGIGVLVGAAIATALIFTAIIGLGLLTIAFPYVMIPIDLFIGFVVLPIIGLMFKGCGEVLR